MKKEIVSFDFKLDNIISVRAPRGTDPETLHDQLREQLKDLVCNKSEVFTFEGIFSGRYQNGIRRP